MSTPPHLRRFSPARLRQRRAELGLSQLALARLLGLTSPRADRTIQAWEAGARQPGASNLYALAAALGVNADWLMVSPRAKKK